jgi:hypothetical protein
MYHMSGVAFQISSDADSQATLPQLAGMPAHRERTKSMFILTHQSDARVPSMQEKQDSVALHASRNDVSWSRKRKNRDSRNTVSAPVAAHGAAAAAPCGITA